MNGVVSKSKPFDASTVIGRSGLGLALTLHLLLLLVLSRISPRDHEAFGALCLVWPVLVPLAFAFGVAALWHVATSFGGGTSRRVCLAAAIISIVGTGVCGYLVFLVMSALGPRGIELH